MGNQKIWDRLKHKNPLECEYCDIGNKDKECSTGPLWEVESDCYICKDCAETWEEYIDNEDPLADLRAEEIKHYR